MSYNSKYTGAEVENLLDQVANGNTGGGSSGSVDLSGYATKEELNDKVDKVDGKQLSTEDFTTALKEKLDELSNYDDTTISEAVEKLRTDFDTLVSGDTTTAIKTFNEIIAFLDGIKDSESLDSIIASIEQQIAAKYTKPSTGIPKSDLASDVQTSLGKADTALQSYTEQYKGTVTGVKMNGTTKNPSSGVVDLGTVITAHQDISGKQDKLVSGTNIKTINGTSILGSGDIVIEGGSSSGGTSSGSAAYPLVVHDSDLSYITLTPNTFHVWGETEYVGFELGEKIDGVANEYLLQFTSGEAATTLELPQEIAWANNQIPTFESNKIYQISILNDIAAFVEVDLLFSIYLNGETVSVRMGMTWGDFVNSELNEYSLFIDEGYVYDLSGEQVRISNGLGDAVYETDRIYAEESYSSGGFNSGN